MPNIQMTTDEIQEVLKKLDSYLTDLKTRWDQQNQANRSWFSIGRTYIISSTIFLINVLDEIIQFVEPLIPIGSDKKAAVTIMVSKLFDYIVIQAFPFWLKPMAPTIKKIIVDVIISNLIDFIVEKYNNGSWKMETNGSQN